MVYLRNFDHKDLKPMLITSVILIAISLMIFPIPSYMLDIGITFSFALSIYTLTLSIFIKRPMEFNSFPMVLLLSIILRLCLNIASTRLIIGNGHTGTNAAGHVIEAFADIIISSNMLLGIVIFIILNIINFMVITKGAGRMAEVGARFALDGLPGRQMSIDADLASGAISHEEAKSKRELELSETTYFGSLDGTSKFMKGDAIAGILITIINILFGIINGVLFNNISLGEASKNYTILTIGDALVGQFPAVLMAISAAIILTKGGDQTSKEYPIISNFLKHPGAIYFVAATLIIIGIIPNTPGIPFLALSILITYLAAFNFPKNEATNAKIDTDTTNPETHISQDKNQWMCNDDIQISVSPNLIEYISENPQDLNTKISNIRHYIASRRGVIIPEISISDLPTLEENTYQIKIKGTVKGQGKIFPNKILAILGNENHANNTASFIEPVFGAKSYWADNEDEETLSLKGTHLIRPLDALTTHLMKIIKDNIREIMTYGALKHLLEQHTSNREKKGDNTIRSTIDEIINEKISIESLNKILKRLIYDDISICNLISLIEKISEIAHLSDIEKIYEKIRSHATIEIINEINITHGCINFTHIEDDWINIIGFKSESSEQYLLSISKNLETLTKQLSKTPQEENHVILCPKEIRFDILKLARSNGCYNKVIIHTDLSPRLNLIKTNTVVPL